MTGLRPEQLTPGEQFLYRQGLRILSQGGTTEDVRRFVEFVRNPEARPREAEEAPGRLQGLTQQFLQGLSFGFGDEALGTLSGYISGEGGQAGREAYRQQLAAFQGEHPNASLIAQLIGAGATAAVPGAGAILGGGGALRAATIGAGTAGLAAAGTTEGGVGERVAAATSPATLGLGAALGSAAGPTTRIVGRGLRQAGRAVGAVAPRVGEAIQSAIRSIPGSPASVARKLYAKALELDKRSLTEVRQAVETRAARNIPVSLAELGGSNVMKLATDAQAMRGPLQNEFAAGVAQRQGTQGLRLLQQLGSDLKVGLQNAYKLARQTMNERFSTAQPFYDQAFNSNVRISPKATPNLWELLRSQKVWREAYEIGQSIAEEEDAAKLAVGLPVSPLPDFSKVQDVTLSVRGLDYMKKGLDRIIKRRMKEDEPLSNRTIKAQRTLLNQALEEVDAQIPAYGRARSMWHGYSEALDALDEGRVDFRTKPPEQVAEELAATTPANRSFYKIGALQDMYEMVQGTGVGAPSVVERIFGARLLGAGARGQPLMQQRIAALFEGDMAAAQEFLDRLTVEAATIPTFKMLGRKTALPQPARAAEVMAPPGVTKRVISKLPIGGGRTPNLERARDIVDELTELFMAGLDDPSDAVSALAELEHLARAERAVVGAGRRAGGQLGARLTVGGATGRF